MNNISQKNRYNYLDNLKWAVTILVIIHHSAIIVIPPSLHSFGINLPRVSALQWQYAILDQIPTFNQSFFMALFFFISAYFVAPSFHRKGAKKFLYDKAIRLGIPLLLSVFVIFPLLSVSVTIKNIEGFWHNGNINFGVTWFVWTLLVFSGWYALYRRGFGKKEYTGGKKKLPSVWSILLFAIVIIPINYLFLYLNHILGNNFLGFHLLKYFPMYIAMFYFGVQAYKYQWLAQLDFSYAFLGILMWIFAILFINPIVAGYGFNPQMSSRGFTVIGMGLFLLYGFKLLFNGKNRFTALLTRTAYAAYVLQIIPLFFIGIFLIIHPQLTTQIPIINFVIVAIPSITLSFLLAYIIVKIPGLRRVF